LAEAGGGARLRGKRKPCGEGGAHREGRHPSFWALRWDARRRLS
jgi:hypothetical protein